MDLCRKGCCVCMRSLFQHVDEEIVERFDSPENIERQAATLYFQDGIRKIDYIMSYSYGVSDSESHPLSEKRLKFEEGLTQKGLELETEPKEESQDQKTFFVKIHIPWETRLKYAERMKMKMPLKEGKDEEEEPIPEGDDFNFRTVYRFLNLFLEPFKLHNAKIREKFSGQDCYTSEFVKDKIDFFDIKDENTFFSSAERSRMAYRILSETRYGEKRIDVGIDRLMVDGIYNSAYPLHEGLFLGKENSVNTDSNMRRILYWEWARWGRWYKFQPLDLVRQYFGDKIGIYFAWLGFYTNMLMYPSILGIIIFIYSLSTLSSYPPTQEICDETYPTYAGNLTMCPLCDVDCTYWKLKSSCFAARITYVFDNDSTIVYAVFMSIWATMFLELWKRRQFELSYDWDLVDYDEERDLIRPEFEARVERERLNPITGVMEPFLAPRDRYSRTAVSSVTVMFLIMLIIAAVFAIIVYRISICAVFAVAVDFSSFGAIGDFATPAMLTTITASALSLVVIMLLNNVYEKIALKLTYMELPRTQIEFEDSFTLKMFCFQFVNFYSFLFYIAFFKNSFAGTPADYHYLFGEWRWEECDAGGCMYELSIQLLIIMFGKQFWNNTVELFMPWGIRVYRQWKSNKARITMPDNEYTLWEQDYDLSPFKQMDLFYEYLEMVIQFGFVTLFAAAFPLAPLLALINNIIEIRLDANKFICELRRPLAQKCADIGAWYFLLDFIGSLSVVTNAFTIAVTSDAIPKMVYYYTYSLDSYIEPTLQGYTANRLSIFNVSDFTRSAPEVTNPFVDENVTECRYRGYLTPPSAENKYELTAQYWHIMAARLAFVIVIEHVVFFLKRFLDYIIPDRPKRLREKIKREHFLVQDMMFNAEKEQLKKQYSQDSGRGSGAPTKFPSNRSFGSENEGPVLPLHRNIRASF